MMDVPACGSTIKVRTEGSLLPYWRSERAAAKDQKDILVTDMVREVEAFAIELAEAHEDGYLTAEGWMWVYDLVALLLTHRWRCE